MKFIQISHTVTYKCISNGGKLRDVILIRLISSQNFEASKSIMVYEKSREIPNVNGLGLCVLNTALNNISLTTSQSVLVEETTDLSQVIEKLYHIKLFQVHLVMKWNQLLSFFIPPLPEGGGGYTVLPLSVLPSVQDIFRCIFLSNC